MPKSQKPQARKSKAEIDAALKHKARVEKSKALAHRIFPALTNLPTVYDAQTALNAAAGHIKYGLVQEEAKLTVANLSFELGKGKSDVDYAVHTLLELLGAEKAREAMEIFELMGNKLPEFLALRGLKEPMSSVTAEEFIA